MQVVAERRVLEWAAKTDDAVTALLSTTPERRKTIFNEAVELPNFRHPLNAAYILGPELGRLRPGIVERCEHIVRIPTAFSLNVATTGAIVMYDRLRTLGNRGARPVSTLGAPLPPLQSKRGGPILRRAARSS